MKTKISDLRSRMTSVTIEAKVVEKSKIQVYQGKKNAKAVLEDESGRITLNLWRDQVDQIKEGDTVRVIQAFIHGRGRKVQASTWKNIEVIESTRIKF